MACGPNKSLKQVRLWTPVFHGWDATVQRIFEKSIPLSKKHSLEQRQSLRLVERQRHWYRNNSSACFPTYSIIFKTRDRADNSFISISVSESSENHLTVSQTYSIVVKTRDYTGKSLICIGNGFQECLPKSNYMMYSINRKESSMASAYCRTLYLNTP